DRGRALRTGSAVRGPPTIGRRATVERRKSVCRSTLVGWSAEVPAPRLAVMHALRQRFAELLGPEDETPPPGHRSRRDWLVDGALFVLAVGLGTVSLVSSAQHGLGGGLRVVDAVCGAALCLALWW